MTALIYKHQISVAWKIMINFLLIDSLQLRIIKHKMAVNVSHITTLTRSSGRSRGVDQSAVLIHHHETRSLQIINHKLHSDINIWNKKAFTKQSVFPSCIWHTHQQTNWKRPAAWFAPKLQLLFDLVLCFPQSPAHRPLLQCYMLSDLNCSLAGWR